MSKIPGASQAKRSLGRLIFDAVALVVAAAVALTIIRAYHIDSPRRAWEVASTRAQEVSACFEKKPKGMDMVRCFWSGKINVPGTKTPEKIPTPDISKNPVTPSNPSTNVGNGSVEVNAVLDKLNNVRELDRKEFNEVKKAGKYDRAEWKHWVKQGNGCTTRENVLVRQGKNVKTAGCKVKSGEWVDPYSGETITNPKDIDIDHVIPLEYANNHGGKLWSPKAKETYANDVDTVLLATSARENRAKGSKGPAKYMPPNKAYSCQYSKQWVNIADKYKLALDKADKDLLLRTLASCN